MAISKIVTGRRAIPAITNIIVPTIVKLAYSKLCVLIHIDFKFM